MTMIKPSFKPQIAKGLSSKKPFGTEHGGAVVNSPQNYAKTGDWKIVMPKVSALCMACQMCVRNCPEAVVEMADENGQKRAVIDYDYCKGCGICAELCPAKAIKMEK